MVFMFYFIRIMFMDTTLYIIYIPTILIVFFIIRRIFKILKSFLDHNYIILIL
jgi:hypothetical protein